eukprot:TRINITY_DN180_c0_g1_i4.p1 TRINITY_DN180_c0_g1~~TRINITY_DN180_c0_g1_i4.p1  ORF type:complete len:325 (+),score=79.20 TRINITY_DN180_c0_g1_i4:39-977(+)
MKFILVVLLLISLSIVFADEAKVFGKRDSDLVQANVKRDNITLPETCQCIDTDSNGKITVYACSKDEANNDFCSTPVLQKRGDDDEDEGNQRRPGPSHHDNDDEDEWRHNRPGYGGRPERPERPRLPNLIKNGGFENDFNNWNRLVSSGGSWQIQTRSPGAVQQFFSELDIPFPPEGTKTAMVASPLGFNIVTLSQEIDLSQFSQCTAIKFELSFKYFYRNYADDFGILQYFAARIYPNSSNFPIHTAFTTASGDPKSTGNEYKRHKSEFLVSTGINSTPLSSFRVVFGQGSLIRLRVGIDDVQLTGRCHNF